MNDNLSINDNKDSYSSGSYIVREQIDNYQSSILSNTEKEYSNSSSYEVNQEELECDSNYSEDKFLFPQVRDDFSQSELPRPTIQDIKYKSELGDKFYLSKRNTSSFPPISNSNFVNIEDDNSSIRLIRPSMQFLPYDLSFYKSSKIKFGFNIEPFASDGIKEERVNEVKRKTNDLLRCSKCHAFYNSNFKIKLEQNCFHYKKYSYKCSICKNKGDFYMQDDMSINCDGFYDNNKLFDIPQLKYLSVDFIFESEVYNIENFFIFMIDISYNSIKYEFANYIIDSLMQIMQNDKILEFKRKYAFGIYDSKKVYYFYIYKEEYVKCTIMPDINNPYCPITQRELFTDNIKHCIIILEKISSYITHLISFEEYSPNSSAFHSVILSLRNLASNTLSEGKYFNNFIFSFNTLTRELINHNTNDNINNLKKKNFLLYTPQREFVNFNKAFYLKNCSFSFFISGIEKNQVHLANYFNYNIYYYHIKQNDHKDIKQKFEKIYYDLFCILTPFDNNSLIYDIKYQFCYNSIYFSSTQLFLYSPITSSDNIFKVTNCLNKNNLCFLFEVNQLYESSVDFETFQFWISYISEIDNKRHLRILNYSISSSENLEKIYSYLDIDCVIRILLCTELNKSKNYDLIILKEQFKSLIASLLVNYKLNVYMGSNIDSINLPVSLRFLILYIYAFFYNSALLNIEIYNGYISNKEHYNSQSWQLYKLFTYPLSKVISMIYPLMRLINKEKYLIIGLNQFFIKKNHLLLYDDGDYVYLFIMEEVGSDFIKKFFNCNNIEELKTKETIEFYYDDNEDLMEILKGRTVRIELVSNDTEKCELFKEKLIENYGYNNYIYSIKEKLLFKIGESI